MGIKHRADSGFRKFRTLIKVRFVRTVKYFEMPYVSYPRPLVASVSELPLKDKLTKNEHRQNESFKQHLLYRTCLWTNK